MDSLLSALGIYGNFLAGMMPPCPGKRRLTGLVSSPSTCLSWACRIVYALQMQLQMMLSDKTAAALWIDRQRLVDLDSFVLCL